jgi:hypothetical protein
MTNPVDITEIIPSKMKTWVGLIGSLLTFIGPFILQSTDALPSPWPAVVGALFAVLTALGIYRAPYKPKGTVLAVDPNATEVDTLAVGPDAPVAVEPPHDGTYENPWKK